MRRRRDGVIRVVALIDHAHLGLDIRAMVGIRVSGDVEQLAQVIARIREGARTAIVTGPFRRPWRRRGWSGARMRS